ncbi:MAG: hypothetical protein A2Y34_05895 [Spirochaetes bacterium GWC1_27_15]|nr:MAG: hypothetical protein A2Y34_05895 [Spirochaetes bacterium GWC1_27_15]
MEFIKSKYILVVDDDYTIRKKLEILLKKNGFNVNSFESGKEVIDELNINYDKYSLILLDVTMFGMTGFETAQEIKKDKRFDDIPIIFITGNADVEDKKKGFEAGCVDYITKPFDNNEVLMRVKLHLELAYRREEALNYAKTLEKKVEERTLEINLTRKALIVSLSSLAESRDPETGAHILRTQEYSKIIAAELVNYQKYKNVIDDLFIERMHDCAPLHDIGKVGIPDDVLLKPGKLTDEEFAIMKTHCYIGKKTLESGTNLLIDLSFLKFASEIAYSHHEKFDGTGYPRMLKGEDIPLQGRIMALSDVYDALTSKRIYKNSWSHQEARNLILSESCKHFDPLIIEVFLKIENDFINIQNKYRD